MIAVRDFPLVHAVHDLARPLSDPHAYDDLVAAIGDARLVLMGEATHGTHELYAERARLTQRLVEEKGFSAVSVEADWPDAFRVNRFVRGSSEDLDADAALSGFERFPAWMWRNSDVLAFVRWLRVHNHALAPGAPPVGFYGLDVYGLRASIEEALRVLDGVDQEAGRVARERCRCFDAFARDVEHDLDLAYGNLPVLGVLVSCEDAVVRQLVDRLQREVGRELPNAGGRDPEASFHRTENSRALERAEAYYRTMYRGGLEAWNLRERHMAETLEEVIRHLDQRLGRGKVVVWGHNSHLGDAQASDLGWGGALSVGSLVRERHEGDAFLIGFTTHSGTVTAASTWGGPAERKRVRTALPESYEALFHRADIPSFALDLRELGEASSGLHEPRLERAIGVVYLPSTERRSHYFRAILPDQFDAVIHLDATTAVEPVERLPQWDAGEPPESFPFGL